MKPFHTYRDGLPPSPGAFFTADSIDKNATPLRVGDIVTDPGQRTTGIVVAVAGNMLIYLVAEPDENGELDWFFPATCHDVTVIGHAHDVLREVARIEAAAEAERT